MKRLLYRLTIMMLFGCTVFASQQPPIYVPYEDMARLIGPDAKAVLMNRDDFAALLKSAQAQTDTEELPETVQILRANYQGVVSGEKIVVTGTLTIESTTDNVISVPLGFGQIGIHRARLNDGAAPLGFDEKGRLCVILTKAGSHEFSFEGTVRLQELASGGLQFSIAFAPALAGMMHLQAEGDIEVHSTAPIVNRHYDDTADETTAELPIGQLRQISVVLLGNGRRQDENAILLGRSACTVNINKSHQEFSSLYTVDVLRRGVRQLRFRVPNEWTVTEVTCPNLVKWAMDSDEQPAPNTGYKLLTVRLRSARTGTTALHIKGQARHQIGQWTSPRMTLDGAEFERGYLMVIPDRFLRVRGERLTDAHRAEIPAHSPVTGIVSASQGLLYFHWNDHWSVDLELAHVLLRRHSRATQSLVVSSEKVMLTGDFEVTAVEQEMYDVSFFIPGPEAFWEIETILLNDKTEDFEYRIEKREPGRLLKMELAHPVMPEKLAKVKIVLRYVPSQWQWTDPTMRRQIALTPIRIEADQYEGHVTVSSGGDLASRPIEAPKMLQPVPVGRMASLGMASDIRYAFAYTQPAMEPVQLEVSRRKPRMSAASVGLLSIKASELTGQWRVVYDVTRASVKKVFLLADKTLSQNINIACPEVKIISKQIVKPGEDTVIVSETVAERYNLWQLELDAETIGQVTLNVSYTSPTGENSSYLPFVRPMCSGRTEEKLAIEASEELAMDIQATQAKEIDAIDLGQLPFATQRILAAFELPTVNVSEQQLSQIKYTISAHANYAIPTALVDGAYLTTLIDVEAGQRTQAVFRITNASRQFFTFRLPDGSRLWSLRVNDRQIKPQQSADDLYQAPLPRDGKTVTIKVVYEVAGTGSDLDEIALSGIELVDMEVNRMSWTVYCPPGYRLAKQYTDLQAHQLPASAPAYTQLMNYAEDYLFGGALFMPTLSKAKSTAYQHVAAWGVDESMPAEALEMDATIVQAESGEAKASELTKDLQQAPKKDEAHKPASKAQVQMGGLARRGRRTLPVELAIPAGSQAVSFSGLGKAELMVGLANTTRMTAWYCLGFLFVVVLSILALSRPIKHRILLLIGILAVSSLTATWELFSVPFCNGAFVSAVCCLFLYPVLGVLRWAWKRYRWPGAALAKTAAAFVLLCLLGAFSSDAYASQKARTPASSIKPKPVLPERSIIPYSGDPTQAEQSEKILVPYSRYIELWNRAYPEMAIDELPAHRQFSLADVQYQADVGKDLFELNLTAHISTYGQQWVMIPLSFKGLAVAEVTLDDEIVQLQTNEQGTMLILPGKTEGRLSVRAVTKPHYTGAKGTVRFTLPPLPAAVMHVQFPENEMELEVKPVEGVVEKLIATSGTAYQVPLGVAKEHVLQWQPKFRSGITDRTLTAACEHDVYAFHWSISGKSKIRYSFSGAANERFSFLMPAHLTLTQVLGANIREHRQLTEKNIDGKAFKVMEVVLHRPVKEAYDLEVRWLNNLPEFDAFESLLLPQADQVHRESGSVTLHAVDGMNVKVGHLKGGRRVSLKGTPEKTPAATSDQSRPISRYYWPYRPFSMEVQLTRLQTQPEVHLDQLIRVEADQVQLLVETKLQTARGRIFGADFKLPGGYELLSVVGPAIQSHYQQTGGGERKLHIQFNSGQTETTIAMMLVRKEVVSEEFHVPRVVYLPGKTMVDTKQTGRLAIQIAASLDAETLSSSEVVSIPPSQLTGWLGESQRRAVQFAYRYDQSDSAIRLKIQSQPTRRRVEIFTAMAVQPAAALYTYRLRYHISGSPVDTLKFRMPAMYASLAVVESPAMRDSIQRPVDDNQTEWTISLINEVTGIVDIAVNFSIPIDSATAMLPMPQIQAADCDQTHTLIAIQNTSRHDIDISTQTHLADLPISQQQKMIPLEVRRSLQYVLESFRQDWAMEIALTPAKAAARIQAVVDLMAMTTVIDARGRSSYRVVVTLQNRSEQFLRVQIPEGLRLWSASVSGQPVKPVIDDKAKADEVLIPLVKTSPGGLPYDVMLDFAGQGAESFGQLTRLKPPAVRILGIPVMQTTWSLHLPDEYRYLRPGGNVSSVAGTAEMLSLATEVNLKQLRRLERSYRSSSALGSDVQEEYARRNIDELNKAVGRKIQQVERYIEDNRGALSDKEYGRLQSRVAEQRQTQETLIQGHQLYVQQQSDLNANGVNWYLNNSVGNAGVAEDVRNIALGEKPEFISFNEGLQIDRLKKELAESEKQQKEYEQLLQGPQGQAAANMQTQSMFGVADQRQEMNDVLNKLSVENTRQVRQQYKQVQSQLSEFADNRASRYFNMRDAKAKGQVKANSRTRGALNAAAQRGKRPSPKQVPAREPVVSKKRSEVLQSGMSFDMMGQMSVDDDFAVTVDGVVNSYAYNSDGTYSLPVQFSTGGGTRLDFAHPSGDAILSIWAVSRSLLNKCLGTVLILLGLAVTAAIVRYWPQSGDGSTISVKRMVIYITLFVVSGIVIGLSGLVISFMIIGFCQIKRAKAAVK